MNASISNSFLTQAFLHFFLANFKSIELSFMLKTFEENNRLNDLINSMMKTIANYSIKITIAIIQRRIQKN